MSGEESQGVEVRRGDNFDPSSSEPSVVTVGGNDQTDSSQDSVIGTDLRTNYNKKSYRGNNPSSG